LVSAIEHLLGSIKLLYSATTHSDLYLRAIDLGIQVKVIHNASIMNAIGCCGLQLYNFGQTVSIPLFQGNWRPDSFYDKIASNAKDGLHTLCLLGKCIEAFGS
jgi:diphthine synthase